MTTKETSKTTKKQTKSPLKKTSGSAAKKSTAASKKKVVSPAAKKSPRVPSKKPMKATTVKGKTAAAKKSPGKKPGKAKPAAATKQQKPKVKKVTQSPIKKAAPKATATKAKRKSTVAPAPKSQKAKKVASKESTTKKSGNIKGKEKSADVPKQTKIILERRTRNKSTPAVFKLPTRKSTPVVFTLNEVREVLAARTAEAKSVKKTRKSAAKTTAAKTKSTKATQSKPTKNPASVFTSHRKLGAASITDILGYNPAKKGAATDTTGHPVPGKFQKHYKKLMDLQKHVMSGLSLHTTETIQRSGKEAVQHGQKLPEVGDDDTFDRDFALSLVSNDQEALQEVDAAIQRIFNGTYGICEITGKPISGERLDAVPFTRFSVKGQIEHEQSTVKRSRRGGIFIDLNMEDAAQFTDPDSES